MLDIKQIEEYEKLIADPREFIENFCYIVTKNGTFELLKLNKPQQKLMDVFMEKYKRGVPIRIRILKARQMGFSTLISALGFWWSAMHENRTYAVVAHKEDSASSIYEKNRIFFNNLPKPMKPMTNKFNTERISFDDDGKGEVKGLRSKIFFGTAGGGELFRGETITFLHKSEKAFWDDKQGMLDKSINATVPDVPLSCIIDETTANGYNKFKDEWDASVRGENSYYPLFVGWHEIDEYSKTPPPNWEMTEKEMIYQLEHDLTDAQMYWRRTKIQDDFGGNEMFFQQEYPLTAEESFIASGFSVYDAQTIMDGYKNSHAPKHQYQIKSVMVKEKLLIWELPKFEEQLEYGEKVVFSEEEQSWVHEKTDVLVGKKYLYENYVIGVDTSGLGKDKNVISVWKSSGMKKNVARFKIQDISERNLAMIIVEIAKLYFNALVAVETNFSHSIIEFILELGYKRLYITENLKRIDKHSDSLSYGWQTTKSTKAPMVSTLRNYLDENPEAIPDKEFWYESEYYIMEDLEKLIMNAASGHFDDILIANSIAYYVSTSFQAKQNISVKTSKEDDIMNTDMMKFLNIGVEKKKRGNVLRKGIYTNNA